MVQKEQKACEEESYLGYEKHVKKIEYDIKQILHKHNE